MAFSSMQTVIETAYPGDTMRLFAAFDVIAQMLKTGLAYRGLKHVWGKAPPKQLVGFGDGPNVLLLPGTSPATFRNLTFGNLTGATGGKRERLYPFSLYAFYGADIEAYEALVERAEGWDDAFDLTFAAYPSLDGAVQSCGLKTCTWGAYPYGWTIGTRLNYWGHHFTGELLLHRSTRTP